MAKPADNDCVEKLKYNWSAEFRARDLSKIVIDRAKSYDKDHYLDSRVKTIRDFWLSQNKKYFESNFGSRVFQYLSLNEIDEIARNNSIFAYVILLELQDSKDPTVKKMIFNDDKWKTADSEKIKILAHLILAYDLILGWPSSGHYSQEQFNKLAAVENLPVTLQTKSYRYDSRSPESIFAQKGFYPNPDKLKGTLIEHSGQTSGGAGFVSLSTEAANRYNLEIGPVINAAADLETDEFENGKIYEYEIEDVMASATHVDTSIVEEREVVVPFVPLGHIARYRVIELRGIVDTGVVFGVGGLRITGGYSLGPWLPFKPR